MSSLQVKNVPEKLHDRIRQRAAAEGFSLSDFALRSVERELSRVDWLDRLRRRSPLGNQGGGIG